MSNNKYLNGFKQLSEFAKVASCLNIFLEQTKMNAMGGGFIGTIAAGGGDNNPNNSRMISTSLQDPQIILTDRIYTAQKMY